ncbi:hypothetical protein HMF7854_07745 [Sphingomonas ginkgonis]|uniref:Uncharacterized protein n=1 Tax=Sphingomonas ginkgonis TaxID=2315330 RepID=A0A3R9Z674_9SPHN|nr:hypothetical protein [Sphingomonas ginkgonis]RST30736.1 hypothetical protein HMF7854_07745 [Sphingomonas ginkgonis]
MEPGDVFGLLIAFLLPTILLLYLARRWFNLREKRLEVEARVVAEKTAQYAASNMELEHRVRILEQIVTDRGLETASQIEALRARPRLSVGE